MPQLNTFAFFWHENKSIFACNYKDTMSGYV